MLCPPKRPPALTLPLPPPTTQALGDIVIGSVLGDSSQRAIQCRIAALLAGVPDTVPLQTVNRQCSSGLQAVASVAAAIKSGYYTVGLAGGVESMSTNPMAWEGGINPRVADNEAAQSCLIPMGECAEGVVCVCVCRVEGAWRAQEGGGVCGCGGQDRPPLFASAPPAPSPKPEKFESAFRPPAPPRATHTPA